MKRSTLGWIALIVGAQAIAWGMGYSVSQLAESHAAGGHRPHANATEVPRKTVADLQAAIKSGAKPLVVDLRGPTSYQEGHIPGAVQVNLSQLQRWAGSLTALDRQRPVYLLCACPAEQSALSGAVMMSKMGFPETYALLGGFQAWRSAKAPIETGGKSVEF